MEGSGHVLRDEGDGGLVRTVDGPRMFLEDEEPRVVLVVRLYAFREDLHAVDSRAAVTCDRRLVLPAAFLDELHAPRRVVRGDGLPLRMPRAELPALPESLRVTVDGAGRL